MDQIGNSLDCGEFRLDPLAPANREALHSLLCRKPVRRYLLDGAAPDRDWVDSVIQDSMRDFARRGTGLWAVRPADTAGKGDPVELPALVGFRDFQQPPQEELLYALVPGLWGRGIATRLAARVIDHAFTAAGRERILASTDLPNRASLAVLERLGFTEVSREPAAQTQGWMQVHFALERGDWPPAVDA